MCIVEYSTVEYSTVEYSIVEYSTVQYNTVQYITIHYNSLPWLYGQTFSCCHLQLEGSGWPYGPQTIADGPDPPPP